MWRALASLTFAMHPTLVLSVLAVLAHGAGACLLRLALGADNYTVQAFADASADCYDGIYFADQEGRAASVLDAMRASEGAPQTHVGSLACAGLRCSMPYWRWWGETSAHCKLETLLPNEERWFMEQQEYMRLAALASTAHPLGASQRIGRLHFEHAIEDQMVMTPHGPAMWRCRTTPLFVRPRALVCRHDEPGGRDASYCLLDCTLGWWTLLAPLVSALIIVCAGGCLVLCAYAAFHSFRARTDSKRTYGALKRNELPMTAHDGRTDNGWGYSSVQMRHLTGGDPTDEQK